MLSELSSSRVMNNKSSFSKSKLCKHFLNEWKNRYTNYSIKYLPLRLCQSYHFKKCFLIIKAHIFVIFSIKKISILQQHDLSIQLSTSQKFSDLLMILISSFYNVSMRAKSLQSCLTLCNPMDCSLTGSSVHGILQAGIQEWVAISFSSGSSWPRDRTSISCIAGSFLHCRWIL